MRGTSNRYLSLWKIFINLKGENIMLWKLNGKLMKSPSTYDDDIEDTDKDSYSSIVDGSLIDNPIAVGLLKCNMSWDLLTEEEAEELLQAT